MERKTRYTKGSQSYGGNRANHSLRTLSATTEWIPRVCACNGRIGRLLITFLLCEKDVLLKPVLYLSHYFKRNRQRYYDLLQSVRDEGNWETWLQFFLRGVFEVSQQATDTSRHILDLRERHRQLITDQFGRAAGNGHRVLEHLYQNPIVQVTEVEALIKTTYPAANNLVRQFVKHGVLQEMTGQKRNRRFIYQHYIALFHDGTDNGEGPT